MSPEGAHRGHHRQLPARTLATRPSCTAATIPKLKPQQRLVLLLRAEGHSYKAICELTDHTYTWVNLHISEGRQALRLLIDDQ